MTSQTDTSIEPIEGGREGDVHPSLEDIHHCVINLVTDEKSKINKDTGRQLLKYFPQMMAMVGRQTTEIEVLKAKLEERGKVFSYADALLGRVGEGTRTAPLPAAQPAAPQPGAMGPSITGRPKQALLIYLRTPAANASNDIKVMLKKYFNPHSLGLTDVSLREIRDGIAVQSNTTNDLELLCATIEEHPSTKDVFVLRKPNKRNPQFRVSGVDPDILPAELLTTVNTQNEGLEILPQDFHHRTMFKEKSGNVTHIFEVTAEAYPKIKEKSRLRLGWTMCAVNENFYVPRCDKCCTSFTVEKIDSYYAARKTSERNKRRSYKFVTESFVRASSLETASLLLGQAMFVVVRGRCYHSQKMSGRPYGITATFLEDGCVWASSCECAAKEGLCNHVLALLRLIVLLKRQGYEKPPPEVACTELPQQWQRPRGSQIPATSVAQVDWRAVREGGSSKPRGSRHYDTRKRPRDLSEMQDAIPRLGSDLCALGDSPFAKHLRTVQILGTDSTFVEELKGEFKEEREKLAVLDTQVKELNDELRQKWEKQAKLENLGVHSGDRQQSGEMGEKKVAALQGTGMKELMDTAAEMLTVNKGEENFVVVHAGLNDVFSRRGMALATHIEKGVKQLRVITSGMAHIVMCSIPEVRGRGVGTGGQSRRLTGPSRDSSKNGYEVMNVNRESDVSSLLGRSRPWAHRCLPPRQPRLGINSWPFLRDGEPPSATTTTSVNKQSLVRQGLPCEASPSRTTSSQQRSSPSRRPMVFRSGAVFVVAPATKGSFVRPPTVAASPARNKDISTESARVDPGVYDSTVGGLATLPPCSSPAYGGVERCATLRRHSPGPGEVPCPRSPQFLLQPRLQFLPLPRQPQPLPLQSCLQLRLQFL
ncbi:hypothetical protein HPB47_007042 [Ixodes persulcatus]|uniref:Uncharacterized protein n=1 Tax=Ixodes persulcatus TaxID=34615 RepID=A0AC60P921_IXOPE|nr:hypothetical protein HPB47_007042 [Ixodes persulcatus]